VGTGCHHLGRIVFFCSVVLAMKTTIANTIQYKKKINPMKKGSVLYFEEYLKNIY
jgi:hypothetical protein